MGLGLVVARIVVRSGNARASAPHVPPTPRGPDTFRVRARDAHPDAPARRPVSARDELADATPIPMPKLRAAADDEPPAEQTVFPRPDEDEPRQRFMRTPDAEPLAPPMARSEAHEPVLPEAANFTPAPELELPKPVPPASPAPEEPATARPATAAERIAGAHPSELSPVELIERLAIAMQRRNARANPEPRASETAEPARDERIATIESLRDTLAALRGAG